MPQIPTTGGQHTGLHGAHIGRQVATGGGAHVGTGAAHGEAHGAPK
ncbi:MAG: hypothetical protein K2W92_07820 [Alphaproteobacteria bacterium]|nr:hypothetical protein [Alphaproteobacteria bacterium]